MYSQKIRERLYGEVVKEKKKLLDILNLGEGNEYNNSDSDWN